MYFCSNCGASLDAGATKCPKCGVAFSGTGTGTEEQRLKTAQSFQNVVKARERRDKAHQAADKRVARKRKAGLRRDPRWEKAATANADALRVLEAYCATLQQNSRLPDWFDKNSKSVNVWASAIIWMRTRPSQRTDQMWRPSVSLFTRPWWSIPFWIQIKNVAVGPHRLDRPTKKAIRHIADRLGALQHRGIGLPQAANYTAQSLKGELDRLLK
jgi:hypothetical protein